MNQYLVAMRSGALYYVDAETAVHAHARAVAAALAKLGGGLNHDDIAVADVQFVARGRARATND